MNWNEMTTDQWAAYIEGHRVGYDAGRCAQKILDDVLIAELFARFDPPKKSEEPLPGQMALPIG